MFAPGAGQVTTAEYGVQRSQDSTAWFRETLVDGETVLNVDTVEDIGRAADGRDVVRVIPHFY